MAQGTTQQFLEIKEIRQGVAILKNQTVRGILLVSSQNFALKSEEEQEATIYQFQQFLNSLDFSVQVIIQSRRLNITGYLDQLKALAPLQRNELLKKQTNEYRMFVEGLISEGSIMTKNFFLVVPFSLIEALPDPAHKGSAFRNVKVAGKLSDEDFERLRIQLWQRMEFIAIGLRRVGLQIMPLSTEEIIELFWSWHHPQEAEVGYYPQIPPELLQ